jgi:predicted acyl esterase
MKRALVNCFEATREWKAVKEENAMKRVFFIFILACGALACGGVEQVPLEAAYQNERYGFSIKYPAEYAQEEPHGINEIFRARPPDRFPVLTIKPLGIEDDVTFAALKDTFKAAQRFAGRGEVEFFLEKETTLSDGVTPAYELGISYEIEGYDLKALSLWTIKHHKWFMVEAKTMAASWTDDLAEMKAMLYSFTAPTWTPPDAGLITFTADVPMRDGKTMPAYVVLPGEKGPYPIIFLYVVGSARVYRSGFVMTEDDNRSIYGPESRSVYGFVFVNRRGMHESAAAAYLGAPTEGQDGADVVQWIASQPWCNGKIGMTGDGRDGGSQYFVAAERPQNLTAIAPELTPALTEDYLRFYPGGVLKEANFRMGAQIVPGLWEMIVSHPQWDDFWDAFVADRPKASDINVPTAVVNGWWDHSVEYIFRAFEDLRTQSPAGDKAKLIVGPWSHAHGGSLKQGDLQYPNAVEGDKAYMRRFHDYWLSGIDNGIYDEPPIYYYQLGEDVWKSTSTWPPPGSKDTTYYLRATGQLSTTVPAGASPGPDTYTYDPQDPSPAIGGILAYPSVHLYPDIIHGPAYQDNEVLAGRDDYLIYDTPVLTQDLETAGRPSVKLYIGCDRPDTDIIVRLCDYDPNAPAGKKTLLMASFPQRMRYRKSFREESWMEPGKVNEVDIEMAPLAYTWKKGHQVRMIVSSSAYPLYALNPNNKDHFMWDEGEPLVAEVKVWHDASHPSHLILPVAGGRLPK